MVWVRHRLRSASDSQTFNGLGMSRVLAVNLALVVNKMDRILC